MPLTTCELLNIGKDNGLEGKLLDVFIYFVILSHLYNEKITAQKWAFIFKHGKSLDNATQPQVKILKTLSIEFNIPLI